MSVAPRLQDVVEFFMQSCPLCNRSNRMVIKGCYIHENKKETYPDIGYSFCNCENIFYTRKENVTDPIKTELIKDGVGIIIQPDPFFVEWGNNPNSWDYWNPRRYEVLWDMHSLVSRLKLEGKDVFHWSRDFVPGSDSAQHFHIRYKLCQQE